MEKINIGDIVRTGPNLVVNGYNRKEDVSFRLCKVNSIFINIDGKECYVLDLGDYQEVFSGEDIELVKKVEPESAVAQEKAGNASGNASKPLASERVNHPVHYQHPSGVECITVARHHNFDIGNALKYLWRAGLKQEEGLSSKAKEIEDLQKAVWYINDRIEELKSKNESV